MEEGIREYLEREKAKLLETDAEIERAIKAELDRRKANRELIERIDRALAAIIGEQVPKSEETFPKLPSTIKEAVMLVLAEEPTGLPALDILSRINKRFGWGYARTSLSPQLSRLKVENRIGYYGGRWFIADAEPGKQSTAKAVK